MENKIDPKRVKRIDLEKMFEIHLDQFKVSPDDLGKLSIYHKVKTAFFNGVVQALIVMNEGKKEFPAEQFNNLLSDLMVQAEQYFSKIGSQPVKA